VQGTRFQALYDAMKHRAPPSSKPMRKGTE